MSTHNVSLFRFHSDTPAESHLAIFLTKIPTIQITAVTHNALLKFAVASLTAAPQALWIGPSSPGRKVIDGSTLDTRFYTSLIGSLAQLGWSGFKPIALPGLVKRTGQLLEHDGPATIALLAELHRSGKLEGKEKMDLVWKKKVGDYVVPMLKAWNLSSSSVPLPFLL